MKKYFSRIFIFKFIEESKKCQSKELIKKFNKKLYKLRKRYKNKRRKKNADELKLN